MIVDYTRIPALTIPVHAFAGAPRTDHVTVGIELCPLRGPVSGCSPARGSGPATEPADPPPLSGAGVTSPFSMISWTLWWGVSSGDETLVKSGLVVRGTGSNMGGGKCVCLIETMNVRFDFILRVKIASGPLTIATGVLWLGMVQQGGYQLLEFSVRLHFLSFRWARCARRRGIPRRMGKDYVESWKALHCSIAYSDRRNDGVERRLIFRHRITFCHIEGGRLED